MDAEETKCTKIPVKTRKDFTDGDNAFPVSYTLNVSVGMDPLRVELVSFDRRPTV